MFDNSDLYFTTVIVGKKGQIIIPAKLRKELSIAPEEQLVILSGPHQEGFAVIKTHSFIERQEKFKKLTEQLFGRNTDGVKSMKTGEKKENKE